MHRCCFCSHPAVLCAGPLRLCGRCRSQLLALAPESRAYPWYAAAIRRALFADAEARSKPCG